jgi:transposase
MIIFINHLAPSPIRPLTTGATDVVLGTNNNDTIIGQLGQSTTLQASDKVSGGAGTDTLRVVTDTAAALSVGGFTVDGVEVLEVQAQAVPIDNNWCENQIRPVALGRGNWLFAGSLRAGRHAAAVMSLIQSAKINGHDPYAYMKDVLTRLPTQRNSQIEDLLPHRWTPQS